MISEILWGVVGGTAGALLIVFGLSKYLGQIWLGRYLEQERKKNTIEIDKIKAKYEGNLQLLQGLIERGHIVHQRQFETEFQAYKELWALIARATNDTLWLRPLVEERPSEITEEDWKMSKLIDVDKSIVEFNKYFLYNRPFMPETIFQSCRNYITLLREEAFTYRYENRGDENYRKTAMDNRTNINAAINTLCDAIRARIAECDPSYTKVN